MGLFEKIFSKNSQKVIGSTYWKALTAYTPVFTTRAGGAYESELVRASIDARARHISKLNIETNGTAKLGTMARLRRRPNEFQTWSQFLYRLDSILDMQNTAFIVPIYGKMGETVGIYSILPSSCEIIEHNNEPWLRYKFRNGKTAALELSSCGILTKFQYDDDIFGGSRTALNNTLDLIDLQNKGIKEAIKNGATYRFMAQLGNFSTTEDLKKEREAFNTANFAADSNGGGMLLFPNTYKDIKQINSSAFVADSSQMKMIETNVFNYYGVNEAILQNKATSAELDAFFNGVIEPFAIQLSEVLTKMFFTEMEIERGNAIYIAANRLQYMSVSEKISLSQQLGDRGAIMIDEIRELFNYPPLPDGVGQRVPIRGEYYFVNEDKPQEGQNNASED